MATTTTTGSEVRGRGTVEGRSSLTPRRQTSTETKSGFKTTELYVTVIAVAGILVATHAFDDVLSGADGWRYATWVVVAYIISCGLAKLGSDAEVEIHEGKDHGSILSQEVQAKIRRQMAEAFRKPPRLPVPARRLSTTSSDGAFRR